MKYYIFTVPKAGTYLLSKALNLLGLYDTGFHISILDYLDTKKLNLVENATNPSLATVIKSYPEILQELPNQSFCFGHLSPLFFPFPIINQFSIIMAIRNPREVLVSEFIDFRYRRIDTEFSKQIIENDEQAFIQYLNLQIPVIEEIFSSYYLFKNMLSNLAYRSHFSNPVIEINFSEFLDNFKGPIYLSKLIKLLNIDNADNLSNLHERILKEDNKTKTVGKISINRENIWTSKSNEVYLNSLLPKYELLVLESQFFDI